MNFFYTGTLYLFAGVAVTAGITLFLSIIGLIISSFFIPGLLPAGITLIIVVAVISVLLAPLVRKN